MTATKKAFQIIGFYGLVILLLFPSATLADGYIVPRKPRTIILDPGHGGRDPGIIGPSGTSEKEITLTLSQLIQNAMPRGVAVMRTRTADIHTSVDQRTGMANHYKGDLFVSIHTGSGKRAPKSIVIYHFGPASSSEDPDTGALMTWESQHLNHAEKSLHAANIMAQTISGRFPEYSVTVQGLPLRALAGASMPGVLMEIGNISETGGETELATPESLRTLAGLLTSAIHVACLSLE